MIVQHLFGVLHEGGVGLQKSLHTFLKFTKSSFGGLVLKRGGGCLIRREVLLIVLVMIIIGKVRLLAQRPITLVLMMINSCSYVY